MGDGVGLTEDVCSVGGCLVGLQDGRADRVGISMGAALVVGKLGVGHDVGTGVVMDAVNLTGYAIDESLLHEQLFLGLTEQIPVPVADGVIAVVGFVVDNHLLAVFELHTGGRVVCIAVGLDVEECHGAMRSGGNGERHVNLFAEGIGHTGVGGDILIVDVGGALDVPVVGRHLAFAHVAVADVVAVVDDGLGAMDEVAGGLPQVLVGIVLGGVVVVVPLRDGTGIEGCQRSVLMVGLAAHAVLVLGIDEAAADTR